MDYEKHFGKGNYDPDARELCLALAIVCGITRNWDGARVLRHAAEHMYHAMHADLRRVYEKQHYPLVADKLPDSNPSTIVANLDAIDAIIAEGEK